MSFKVFIRNWYKMEKGFKVPAPRARKTHVTQFDTYDGARDYCRTQNAELPASWARLSRKYEFTEV